MLMVIGIANPEIKSCRTKECLSYGFEDVNRHDVNSR